MGSHVVRQLSSSRLTIGLALLWLLIEGLRVFAFAQSDVFYLTLGLSREGMSSLLLWQLVSYSLVHGGWVHVLMNVLLLLSLGSRLEWMLGRRSLAVLLLIGAVLGAILHLALSRDTLVGGSGAVFAGLLCLTTLSSESRWLAPFPLSAKNLGRGILLASLLLTLIDPDHAVPWLGRLGVWMLDAGFGSLFGISHACHLGGAVAGWLYARWLLRTPISLEKLRSERARREARGHRD